MSRECGRAFDMRCALATAVLALLTPAAFAAHLIATGPRAALLDGSALSPVAKLAPEGVSTAGALTAAG